MTDAAHRRRQTNLGHMVIGLVDALRARKGDAGITYDDEADLGEVFENAIKAGIKAEIEGKQTDEQIEDELTKAMKAANRQVGRELDRQE